MKIVIRKENNGIFSEIIYKDLSEVKELDGGIDFKLGNFIKLDNTKDLPRKLVKMLSEPYLDNFKNKDNRQKVIDCNLDIWLDNVMFFNAFSLNGSVFDFSDEDKGILTENEIFQQCDDFHEMLMLATEEFEAFDFTNITLDDEMKLRIDKMNFIKENSVTALPLNEIEALISTEDLKAIVSVIKNNNYKD